MKYEIVNYEKNELNTNIYIISLLVGFIIIMYIKNIILKICDDVKEKNKSHMESPDNGLYQNEQIIEKSDKESQTNGLYQNEHQNEQFSNCSLGLLTRPTNQRPIHPSSQTNGLYQNEQIIENLDKKNESFSSKELLQGLNIISYSDKAYVIHGTKTYDLKNKIKLLGGKWNSKLKKFPYKGWVIPKRMNTISNLSEKLV